MKKILFKLKWFYISALVILLFASCDPLKIFGATGSSAQYSLVPTEGLSISHIPNEEFFYVNLYAAYYLGEGFDPLDARMHAMEDYGTDCKIPVEQDSTEDLYCILDVMEGDLWYHQMVLEYNVPKGMCDYLQFDIPWHFNQRVGHGPAVVYECNDYRVGCEINTEGEDTEYNAETETRYCLGGCTPGTTAAQLCGEETITVGCDGAGPVTEAQRFCSFLDQSENELSNCCLGEYILYTEGTSNEVRWAGDLKDCIGGSALCNWDPDLFRDNGIPSPLLKAALRDGYRDTYELPALIEVFDGAKNIEEKPSFITANYWTGVENKEFATSKPRIFVPPSGNQLLPYLRPLLEIGYPYFSWSCLDKTMEVKHRIHLTIREWNIQEEFNTFKDTKGGRGDPDVVGLEGSACEYYKPEESSVKRDTECNDYWDLDDLDNLDPGSGPNYNPYPEVISECT